MKLFLFRGGVCQNLCGATHFRRFDPDLRTIDQREAQKYTFLQRSLCRESKHFRIRAIGATREKVLRQKSKL